MTEANIIYHKAYEYGKKDGMSDREAKNYAESEAQEYLDDLAESAGLSTVETSDD